MTIAEFNQLSPEQATARLLECCHSQQWAEAVCRRRPYGSLPALLAAADKFWQSMEENDLLEAFAAHPKIGDLNSLREKYGNTKAMAAGEQSGVDSADEAVLAELARLNPEYEKKYGFIFIVFATGKSAEEMLTILNERIRNTRSEELMNAAEEQGKIMKLRLEKLL